MVTGQSLNNTQRPFSWRRQSGGRRAALVAAVLVLAAVGCGGDKTSTAAAPKSSARPQPTIVIKNFAFAPTMLQVKVGDTVTVRNDDKALHSLTEVGSPPAFDTGQFNGGERTFTVDKTGTLTFHCTVHSFMASGRIEVTA